MSLGRFLISKTFFKHLGIALVITALIIFGVFRFLKIYTLHGDSVTLPDLSGLTMQELKRYDLTDKFEFMVIDSVYDAEKRKGSIISQDPLANSQVKPGRKIYLTIVAKSPEQVTMPNLVDLTLRQAISQLETYGLKVGELEYVQDIARNAVLQQTYDGEVIKPGEKIETGSQINLVVGKGRQDHNVPVPFVIGEKPDEAIRQIHKASLNVGKQFYENIQDTAFARVFRTHPQWEEHKQLKMGSYVDLWYRSALLIDFDSLVQSMHPDTLRMDTLRADTLIMDTDKKTEPEEPVF